MKKTFLFALALCASLSAWAQDAPESEMSWLFTGSPRVRVLVCNDLCGDADGLFHLAHQLLSTSAEVRGVIGAHVGDQKSWGPSSEGNMSNVDISVERAREVAALCGKTDLSVCPGAAGPMTDPRTPIESEGARLIIEEAHKATPAHPLYLLFGGPLTDIASAWLMDPTISETVVLCWIGGQEYSFGHPLPSQYMGDNEVEYNLLLDVSAARTVFNLSDLPLCQLPRDVYRQALYGSAEILDKIAPLGRLGDYLMSHLSFIVHLADTYVLGDSPLLLVSALTTPFQAGAASSFYETTPAPRLTDDGHYDFSSPGRDIIVYRTIDTRLLFGDMESRFRLLSQKEAAQQKEAAPQKKSRRSR